MDKDTIAAIATAPGNGGVAIIRISGLAAQDVLRRVFSHTGEYPHAKLCYGSVGEDGKLLDKGMAVLFYAPHSYTGQDVAELHCHGSAVGIAAVLECVLRNGARLAQPGEFTRRAFLNGKMDLTQAEAVCDYIGAISSAGARASARQMEGALKTKLLAYQSALTDLIAEVEAAVEYPEEDLELDIVQNALPAICQLEQNIRELEQTYLQGRILKEGLQVAIAGKPNVGKSSLLNALVGKNRAIVSNVPGTTRDTVEHFVEINGIAVNIVDTAGIRSTNDEIEKEGVERSNMAINEADLTILLLDSTEKLSAEDDFVCKRLKEANARVILVWNKIDACESKLEMKQIPHIEAGDVKYISAKTGEGLHELKSQMYHFAMQQQTQEALLITNQRHKELLQKAAVHLADAAEALRQGMDMDCVTIDLNLAWAALGGLTGQTVSEEIINRIFEKFCLGK